MIHSHRADGHDDRKGNRVYLRQVGTEEAERNNVALQPHEIVYDTTRDLLKWNNTDEMKLWNDLPYLVPEGDIDGGGL
jgi:hypothetical protein